MDFDSFLTFLRKTENSPVIVEVLKHAKTLKETSTECVFSCKNLGSKMFLDSRKTIIEESLEKFSGERKTVVFVVSETKTRKKKDEPVANLPIIQYQTTREDMVRKAGILPYLTFETFAVSNSNHIAHAAAKAVSDNPGHIYNPLFIYGDVGVGKTHLAHAIANSLLKKNAVQKALYCTSETFTNDLVDTIRQKNTDLLRKKYRSLDLLIIDDVQFIAGKKYVQEEFYHTFNTLVQNGGQIVLTSDRPPKEIQELEDRLRSRFSGGLIIDMQKPDFELRTAILLIKAKARNINIDMDAAKHLAQQVRDTRELEGTLLKMLSLSLINNTDRITIESTKTELGRHLEKAVRRVPPQDVLKTVSTFYNVKQADIKSSSRKQSIALARQVCMYILRTVFELNYEEIAFILKRKDHTTVLHGYNKIRGLVMKDPIFKDELSAIKDQLI